MITDTPSSELRGTRLLGAPRTFLKKVHTDSLARNSFFLMGTTIVNSALGYAFWVLAARTYSTREVGFSAALISAMTLAAMLSNMGAGSTLVQTLPTRRAGRDWSRTVNACLGAGFVTGAVMGFVALFLLPLVSEEFSVLHQAAYGAVVVLGVLFWTAATILDFAFVAERAADKMLTRNATGAILKLALLGCFVALGERSSLGISSAWTVSTGGALLIGGALLLPKLHRGYRPQLRGIATEARRLFPPLVGHYFINLGGQMSMCLLPLLVATRLSSTSNAYYYTTWMLGGAIFMVSPAVAAALFAEGSHARASLYQKARSSTFLIAALLVGPMTALLLGGRFILGIFGPAYAEHSFGLLILLVVAVVPDAVTNVYVSVLRVQRRFRAAAALNIVMALGTLTLAWYLLPVLGIAGAGLAWLIMQTLGSVAVAIDLGLKRFRPELARDG